MLAMGPCRQRLGRGAIGPGGGRELPATRGVQAEASGFSGREVGLF